MDVPSANGQVHGTQQAWSSHPAHQLHQLGTWAAQNAPNIVNIPDRSVDVELIIFTPCFAYYPAGVHPTDLFVPSYEQFRLEDDQKKIEQAEDPRK